MKKPVLCAVVGLGLLAPSSMVASAAAAEEGPPRLAAYVLGKDQPDAGLGQYQADGSYVLTGTGHDAVDSAEQGSFAGISTEASNFTFVARVAKGPTGTPDPQYGISIRAGVAATGGAAARSAALFPERTIACSPTLIGMAGAETTDPRVLATPHLHIIGARDGGHLPQALQTIPHLREKRALWATAPMWRVYHRTHRSFGLMMPYFVEVMRLRLPAHADYAIGLPHLAALKEDEGWLGLVVSNLNRNRQEGFPRRKPQREFESRGTRGGGC
jgi:hypothetical protein